MAVALKRFRSSKTPGKTPADSLVISDFVTMFRLSTFAAVVTGIFPNMATSKTYSTYSLAIFSYTFLALMLLSYCMYEDLVQNDWYDVTRQMIIHIPLQVMTMKMVLAYKYSNKIQELLDIVNGDYKRAKHMPEKYLGIMKRGIAEGRSCELMWVVLGGSVALAFPLIATSYMIYKNLTQNFPERLMVHEFKIPFFERFKYITPFYQAVALYSLGVCAIAPLTFTGWDGMLLIMVIHCKTQFKVISGKLQDLFNDVNQENYVALAEYKIKKIIKQHHKQLMFFEDLQMICSLMNFHTMAMTSLQICVTGFQFLESLENNDFQFQFIIFTLATMMQAFLWCNQGSMLSEASSDVVSAVYKSGWEKYPSSSIRRSLRLLMTRSDKPLVLTGLGFIPIDLLTYSSILNSSWSYLMLLRSSR